MVRWRDILFFGTFGSIFVLSAAQHASAELDVRTMETITKKLPPAITQMEDELRVLRNELGSDAVSRNQLRTMQRELNLRKDEYEDLRELFYQHLEQVKREGNINLADTQGRTLLMLAAAMGHDNITRMVLNENPAMDAADNIGQTACDYEQKNNGTTVRNILINRWITAIENRDSDAVQVLLNCGADPDWPIANEAPIVRAFDMNDYNLFSMLANSGANVEARLADGRRLVELVIERRNADALEILLRQGCKTEGIFANGRTALDILLEEGSEDCLEVWFRHVQEADKAALLCQVVRLGTPKAVRMIFSTRKESLDTEDPQGNLPLHEAARRGDLTIYRTLIELGASITARNEREETVLMHAALSGNHTLLSEVLSGIPAELRNVRDKNGRTAADYASLAKDTRAQRILEATNR